MKTESGAERVRELCKEVLRRTLPSEEERRETTRFSQEIMEKLREELRRSGIEAEVQVEGSIAKDTWLAGDKDIDIFILLPKTRTRDDFQEVLEVVKRVAGKDWLEAYAEHPYIEAKIGGYTIDFVPSFSIEKAEEAKSSVDRTPLHTQYVKRNLDQKAKNEVRLLKRFMHGTGTYGAEIKVGGFSGYLCELLTLYYGSFYQTLKVASHWRRGEVIDIEGYYKGAEDEARKVFGGNLIVIDPVDKGRNVASAVRSSKLNEFIAAARWFLKNPDLKFFYPGEAVPQSSDELCQTMGQRGSAFVFLKFGSVKTVLDVLWGQLYRSLKAVRKMIEQHDFNVLRCDVWSDEETINIFLFELESRSLPAIKRHLGPPLQKEEDCVRFLHKHLNSERTISGPYIENDRWIVEVRRAYTDVVSLLRDKLKDGGRNVGIANMVSKVLADQFEVLVNEEIMALYSSNREFARFLTEYLNGRPRWLR
ncbi:MAG: CCA tRNA nucleotidyltransferase [Candidatus Bathyarchaeia archaeon]